MTDIMYSERPCLINIDLLTRNLSYWYFFFIVCIGDKHHLNTQGPIMEISYAFMFSLAFSQHYTDKYFLSEATDCFSQIHHKREAANPRKEAMSIALPNLNKAE